MRVAIIHYWLVSERGGEKVLRSLCDLYPDAVIFTHVADPTLVERMFPGHEVRCSFVSRLPWSQKLYQQYLPFMPLALEEFDLSDFDLVISSESGPAKGVIAPPETPHLCYCHSPMRYLWDQYHLYRNGAGLAHRLAFPFLAHRMRQWDVTSSARVDRFVANSSFVAARIKKYYNREADVVHPPVDVARFRDAPRASNTDPRFSDAYLWVGQLTKYKRPELALEAMKALDAKLVVIGDGEMLDDLRAQSDDKISFLGRADDVLLNQAYRECRALIFPGQEDFGMVPVEAMAAGLPVIALNRGGARETVVDGKTGVLFDAPTADALIDAVKRFDALSPSLDADAISRHAGNFTDEIFKSRMTNIINELCGAPQPANAAAG